MIADFNRTITTGDSQTAWSILATSNLVSQSYIDDRQTLYNKYRPIEIDNTLPLDYRIKMMKEWFQKHLELFVKHQTKEDIFEAAVNTLDVMKFRPGAKEFLEFLHQNNIPLIIISAGISNLINLSLKHNNCDFDNIYICSNELIFENNIASEIGKNIIHPLNKLDYALPSKVMEKLQNRNKLLILGDKPNDLTVVNPNDFDFALSVGFVTNKNKNKPEELQSHFDIICEENDNYFNLKQLLF